MQAQTDSLDARATLEQAAQHVGPQTISAFDHFARFLQWLADANFAQQLQEGAFWGGHERGILAVVEGLDKEHRVGLLFEEPLAVVFRRKALGEPIREAARFPAIKIENRPLGHVVADAVPIKRGLAANMQSIEATLQQAKARVQCRWIVGTAVDTTRQSLEPARPHIMDSEIGRYLQIG